MHAIAPGWGYILTQGGTTCWETWDPPPGSTHNHIWLCGGVGEWLYKYLAGIRQIKAGYASVDIGPVISPTVGPSEMNATLQTIRGPVRSSWRRHTANIAAASAASGVGSGINSSSILLFELACTIPVGATGVVTMPTFGLELTDLILTETAIDGHLLDLPVDGSGNVRNIDDAGVRRLSYGQQHGSGISVEVRSGTFKFEIRHR